MPEQTGGGISAKRRLAEANAREARCSSAGSTTLQVAQAKRLANDAKFFIANTWKQDRSSFETKNHYERGRITTVHSRIGGVWYAQERVSVYVVAKSCSNRHVTIRGAKSLKVASTSRSFCCVLCGHSQYNA